MDTSTFLHQELHPKNLNLNLKNSNHKTVLEDARKKCLNTTTIHIKQQQHKQRNECNLYIASANKKSPSPHDQCVNVHLANGSALKKTIIKENSKKPEHNDNEEKCKIKMLNSKYMNSNGTVANETPFKKSTTSFPTFESTDTDRHHLNHVLNIKISPTGGATLSNEIKKETRNGAQTSPSGKEIFLIENCAERKKISVININQERNFNNFKQFCVNMVDFDSELSENNQNNNSNIEKKLQYNKNINSKMSGQCSPTTSDHLDSGTCSDAELNLQSTSPTPAPLPTKKLLMKHNLLSDSICSNSDDSVSSISSDSLTFQNSGNLLSPELIKSLDHHQKKQQLIAESKSSNGGLLPSSLLKDIQTHPLNFTTERNYLTSHRSTDDDEDEDEDVLDYEHDEFENESNYSDCTLLKSPMLVSQVNNYEQNIKYNNENNTKSSNGESNLINNVFYENDKFYKFHINEHLSGGLAETTQKDIDETFAGFKDFNNGTSTIRSSKGTVRGVKNRVRNGIQTFLQMQQSTVKVSLFLAFYLLEISGLHPVSQ
jgi:hypothetical protein